MSAPIRRVGLDDLAYPLNLRATPRPPDPLHYRGDLLPEDAIAVAIVGTRHPSRDGRDHARRLARALAEAGVAVVSGLATGIDAAAHAAAITAGGRTLAVLGHGLAHPIAPPATTALAAAVERAGALVSPFDPDTAPTAATFRARNAVIAGLARVAVVIEAGPTSGARILIRHAAEQHRPVLLAPRVLDTQPWARAFLAAHDAHPLGDVPDVLDRLHPPPAPADEGLQLSLPTPRRQP